MILMKRDWTQENIVDETIRRHSLGDGDPSFFNILNDVTYEAFGRRVREDDLGFAGEPEEGQDWIDLPPPGWRFEMGDLTIGQILDFFDAHQAADPIINWHNASGGPHAEIVIGNYNLAEALREQFRISWDSLDMAKAKRKRTATWR
jgi:hypothetical protein